MQTVAAALIIRGGKLLIAQRGTTSPHPLEWEFPGGKVEVGETPEAALIRELSEELGIRAIAGPAFTSYEYVYPGKSPIRLVFHWVTSYQGTLVNRVFEQLAWAEVSRLSDYNFLAGDLPLIQLLREVHIDQIE